MKDLIVRYFLRLEYAYSTQGYLLNQSKYIDIILAQTRLSDTRTPQSPLEHNA